LRQGSTDDRPHPRGGQSGFDCPKYCDAANSTELTSTIIVEIAAMIGSIWSRSALNTLRVSADLSPPDTWIHMVGFAAVMAGAVSVIIDLEYPRLG